MAKRQRVTLPLPVFSDAPVLRTAPDGTEEQAPLPALDVAPASSESGDSKALAQGRVAWERSVASVMSADGEVAAAAHMAQSFKDALLLPARIVRAPVSGAAQARHIHLRLAHKRKTLSAAVERLRNAASGLRSQAQSDAQLEAELRSLRQRWRVRLVQQRLVIALDGLRLDLFRSSSAASASSATDDNVLQLAQRVPSVRLRPACAPLPSLVPYAPSSPSLHLSIAHAQHAATAHAALAFLSASLSLLASPSSSSPFLNATDVAPRHDAVFVSAEPTPLLLHLSRPSDTEPSNCGNVDPRTPFVSLLLEALLAPAVTARLHPTLSLNPSSSSPPPASTVLRGVLAVRAHLYALFTLCDKAHTLCCAVPGLSFTVHLSPLYTSSTLCFAFASRPLTAVHVRRSLFDVGPHTHPDATEALTHVLRQACSRLFEALVAQAQALPAPFRFLTARAQDSSIRAVLPSRPAPLHLRLHVHPYPLSLTLVVYGGSADAETAIPIARLLRASNPFTGLWSSIAALLSS